MKLIALDLSSHSGVAYFDSKQPELLIDCFDYSIDQKTPMSNHTIKKEITNKKSKHKKQINKYDSSNHPEDFLKFIWDYVEGLETNIKSLKPEIIVIEQTNKGRDRWRQKLLEWLHYELCSRYQSQTFTKIKYIDTLTWRSILNLKMSKSERKTNKRIRKHNKEAQEDPNIKRTTGIISSKTLAINFVQDRFNLNLKNKHHDIADAICIGYSYLIQQGEIDA